MTPTLSVILVHYRTPGDLARAIAALRDDAGASRLDLEIIVVDNGSDAADRERIDALGDATIRSGGNPGYAAAANLGMARATAPVGAVMNPDVVVEPGCLDALVTALDDVAVAGPAFFWDQALRLALPPLEQRSRRHEAARHLARRGGRWAARARRDWRRHARRHWSATGPIASWSLSGALLAIRRDAWERAGPMDEGFRLYFEEADWLERARRLGLAGRYVPAARARHAYNASAGREPAAAGWMRDSSIRFADRYYGRRFGRLLHATDAMPLGRRTARPDPIAAPALDLDVGQAAAPLWIEVSPSPTGVPAAAERLDPDAATWALPADVIGALAPGPYAIRVVDAGGRECRSTVWTHAV